MTLYSESVPWKWWKYDILLAHLKDIEDQYMCNLKLWKKFTLLLPPGINNRWSQGFFMWFSKESDLVCKEVDKETIEDSDGTILINGSQLHEMT